MGLWLGLQKMDKGKQSRVITNFEFPLIDDCPQIRVVTTILFSYSVLPLLFLITPSFQIVVVVFFFCFCIFFEYTRYYNYNASPSQFNFNTFHLFSSFSLCNVFLSFGYTKSSPLMNTLIHIENFLVSYARSRGK